jgi:short-subunit dehydrogenase
MVPIKAIYGASKAAVVSYSENLRLEMAPFGVKVVTILTGAVLTNMNNPTNYTPSTLPGDDSIFKPNEKRIAKADIPDHMSAEKYAEKVVGDILSGATGRIWRGAFASRLWFVTTFLPQRVLVRLFALDLDGQG